MQPTETEIQKAKQLLEDAGYFTDNLWHIDDVKKEFNCTDNEALEVLSSVLTSDYIMETINNAIADTDYFDEQEDIDGGED